MRHRLVTSSSDGSRHVTQQIAAMLLALAVAACFPSHPTPLASCAVLYGAGVSDGVLRVLPSEVAGVTIDSASWQTVTTSPELSTQTSVYYDAELTATVPTPLASFAVQFHSTKSSEGPLLLKEGFMIPKRLGRYDLSLMMGGSDSIRPGERRVAFASISLPGTKPGPWGCPSSVQVVRHTAPTKR